MVVDKLAERYAVQKEQKRFDAVLGETNIAGEKILLVKPLTFMNLSGQAVAPIVRWYKLSLADVFVVHDDLDLPPGKLRIRMRGGAGGHKGLTSVIQNLGTQDINRVRMGIGRPRSDTLSWVLGRFSAEERPVIDAAVENAADALECWRRDGINRMMNTYNALPEGGTSSN
jgi:PTH1 family peptidyl-tRNA hydrolase